MTFGQRIKDLRFELGFTQAEFAAHGFVTLAGTIKIENDQRQPSEQFIKKLVAKIVAGKYLQPATANALCEELLTLKYLGGNAKFLRVLAREHAESLPNGAELLATKPKVGPGQGRIWNKDQTRKLPGRPRRPAKRFD